MQFTIGGVDRIAMWSHLVQLRKCESGGLLKLSKLDDVAIAPTPIERQKVGPCLRVFCEETLTALGTHSGLKGTEISGTMAFIELFVKFWRVANVRTINADGASRDPLRAIIESAYCAAAADST